MSSAHQSRRGSGHNNWGILAPAAQTSRTSAKTLPYSNRLTGSLTNENWSLAKLFEYFGGRPTERMPCHEYATNQVLLAERHRKLAKLFPKIKIPTAAAEKRDPKAALDVYTACIDRVRGIVRTDKTKHADIQRENIQYGFRRNLWAIKPWGISVTLIAGAVLAAEIVGRVMVHEPVPLAQPVIIAVDVLLVLAWILVVTRDWVKRAALLYADRLLETIDTLAGT
jgi:hypothetical protein